MKPFRTKAIKHYASLHLEKKPDLVILHTGTNDLKSVSSPEEIANEIVALASSVKENGQQLFQLFQELFPEEIDSPKKLGVLTKGVLTNGVLTNGVLTNAWKYSVKLKM